MSASGHRDDVFDNAAGWKPFYKDDRFEQRILIVGDTFFTETLVRIQSSPSAVLALLQERWDWWAHVRIFNYTRNADGSILMDMKPIWWYVARFQIRMLPSQDPPDRAGVRLPMLFSGGFEGPGSIDVYLREGHADEVILRGRFHGMREHVRMLFANATTAAWAHLWTEAGRLPLPFARGTGYVGLVRRLESRAG